MKAPFSWPNSSEAISDGGMAPQLTDTNGREARGDRRWIARAISSLPVPVSPVISTVESVRATFATSARTPAQRRRGADDLLEHRGLGDLVAQGDVLLLELLLQVVQLLLRPLAVIDIRDRSIPSDDRARLVSQWNGARQEPSILPFGVAAAHFQFEGMSRGDRLPPFLHDAVAIVRMKHARPLPAEDIVRGVTHPLEPALGQKLESAIGPGRPDEGRDRLENRPELLLRVLGSSPRRAWISMSMLEPNHRTRLPSSSRSG